MKKELKITVGVLGVGLIFGLGIGGGYYLATKNNQYNKDTEISKPSQNNEQSQEENKNNIKENEAKELTETEVADLYAILKRNKDGYGGTINEFFKESKVTYNDLSTFFKYFLTWKSLDLKPISKTFHSKISTANMNDINKYDTIDDFLKSEYESKGIPVTYPNGTIYNTNYEEVASAYKKIFGSDKNVPLEDAETFYLSCYVRNNDYLCMAMDAGGGLESANEFKFVNAAKQNNTITIYNLIVAESKLIEDKINIDNLSDKNWQKYGKKYKSVFKEDSDGNYYWYSTEPVEE